MWCLLERHHISFAMCCDVLTGGLPDLAEQQQNLLTVSDADGFVQRPTDAAVILMCTGPLPLAAAYMPPQLLMHSTGQ